MRILVVRGDLCTHTGYSKALRAIVELTEPYFDRILGVDLHYSAVKSTVLFPYPILDDHQAAGLWRNQNNTVTALHLRRRMVLSPMPMFTTLATSSGKPTASGLTFSGRRRSGPWTRCGCPTNAAPIC